MANRRRSVVRPKSGKQAPEEAKEAASSPKRSQAGSAATTSARVAAVKRPAVRPAPSGRSGSSTAPRTDTTAARTQGEAAAAPRTRTARLRLVHVDPWSVMKTTFLLSIALGIVMIVAVTIIWGVLGASGVWDSINTSVQTTVGSDTSEPFNITDYIGAGRVIGFTMVAAVIDVVVLTALATLGAFVYNLAATLLGGVEMTLAEDR